MGMSCVLFAYSPLSMPRFLPRISFDTTDYYSILQTKQNCILFQLDFLTRSWLLQLSASQTTSSHGQDGLYWVSLCDSGTHDCRWRWHWRWRNSRSNLHSRHGLYCQGSHSLVQRYCLGRCHCQYSFSMSENDILLPIDHWSIGI